MGRIFMNEQDVDGYNCHCCTQQGITSVLDMIEFVQNEWILDLIIDSKKDIWT